MRYDSSSIGKRYSRHDEIGTPYCITVDNETLNDQTVTLRNRDTTEQSRVKIEELVPFVKKMMYAQKADMEVS